MTFVDHWAKTSPIRFLTTQAIYTAWLADTSTGNLKSLFDAIAAMSLNSETFRGINNVGDTFALSVPSSESALNSSKLLVETVDAVNGYADRFYIPGRNPSKYVSSGGFVILGTGATAETDALVTAVENGALKSRYGNSVVVKFIKPVGRHLRRQ
jgi:hypothetical protein